MLTLVEPSDPILHEPCKRFDFQRPQLDIGGFGKALVDFMYEKNALGLAAPQVGYPYQIFAMKGYPENFVLLNPRVVDHSKEEEFFDEGCLSYPGLIVKVKRPNWVEIRANHPDGSAKTYKFDGMSSHVVLHEIAHLNGRTFFDDCNYIAKEKALRAWKKICRMK